MGVNQPSPDEASRTAPAWASPLGHRADDCLAARLPTATRPLGTTRRHPRSLARPRHLPHHSPTRPTPLLGPLTSWCVIAGEASVLVDGMIRLWQSWSAGGSRASVVYRHLPAASDLPGCGVGRSVAGRCRGTPSRGTWRGQKTRGRAGARPRLVFVDRLIATLIHLRHDLPHSVLALLFGVDRSTITRATGEIRRLLAERGCAVPDRPGLRLRTLADVFAYARPRASNCGWTPPRSRSADPWPAAADAGRSSRGRRSRTR